MFRISSLYKSGPGFNPTPSGSITLVLAFDPAITVATSPLLNCGSESTQSILSSSILPWISAMRAGLGLDASPKEIAPDALRSKAFSKY